MIYRDALKQFQREYWGRMLETYSNRSQLAREAGVNRTQLYQTLKELGIKIKDLRHYGKWDV